MKTKLLVFSMILVSISCFAQNGNELINQYNKNGNKEGFWIEDWNHGWRRELYYMDGKMNGICKTFDGLGHLIWFGNFLNNQETGIWYYFGDSGHLMSITKDYAIKDHTVEDKDGWKIRYTKQCYYISYHLNGIIESEGVLLWDKSPYLDTSREYGEWKYYDDKGNLIKTKVYN